MWSVPIYLWAYMAVASVAVALWLTVAGGAAGASKPPHYSMWLCIHEHEHTAWNDPGSPYWGGLQMGSWFLATYSHPPGTPDQWSPLTQMWVAENAYKRQRYSRSWLAGQWPPSRGSCF